MTVSANNRDWAEWLEVLGHDPHLVLAPALPAPTPQLSQPTDFVFVGEDLGGGEARELLDKMISAMGLPAAGVHILDIPEIETQVPALKPRWIISLGSVATQLLLKSEQKIALLRGVMHTDHSWKTSNASAIKIIPTFHPVFLLRNPEMKKACWEDLQMVMRDAGL